MATRFAILASHHGTVKYLLAVGGAVVGAVSLVPEEKSSHFAMFGVRALRHARTHTHARARTHACTHARTHARMHDRFWHFLLQLGVPDV